MTRSPGTRDDPWTARADRMPRRPKTQWRLVIVLVVGCVWVAAHAGVAAAADPVSGDPVVAAVGDMACDPSDPNFNGGAGTPRYCAELAVSNEVLSNTSIDGLLGLGDYQYACGDLSDYAASYTPTWGRLDTLMTPVAGNHEYVTTTDPYGELCASSNRTAQSFFSYFAASGASWAGRRLPPGTAGHFSFDLGAWHIIALNANCNGKGVGGCAASSPQTTWLANDLRSTTQPCILAYWHQPRWTGTPTNNASTSAWWNLLYTSHADLVLNGHIHNYQRFGLLDPKRAGRS